MRNATLLALLCMAGCGDDVGTIVNDIREDGGYVPPPFPGIASSSTIVTPEIIVAPQGAVAPPNPALCGDGSLDQDELCDPSIHPCCNATCNGLRDPGDACREAAGGCDATELCDGESFLCPEDEPARADTICRASTGGCDISEVCDGESNDCPSDRFEDEGTVCRDADGVCDLDETCTGESAQCPDDAVVGTDPMVMCRAADGDLACDAIEYCDGEHKDCPDNQPLPDGTQCQTSLGTCDAAEVCDGESFECPAPTGTAAQAGIVCRISAGPCDTVETCNGASITCPADGFASAATMCRADSARGCDVAETCTGTGPMCPPNAFRAVGTQCRAVAAGGCDVAESCTGEGDACPQDGFAQNTVCRAAVAGGCDVEERCSGSAAVCPADAVRPMGTECRDAAPGGCDVAETCNGTANTCPANGFASASVVCRAAVAGGCDREDRCTGASATCPADAVEANGTVCRPAASGGCDVAEACNGTANTCPSNEFASSAVVCRPAVAGGCDVAESCSGSSASCPSNGFASTTTVCRAAAAGDLCDAAETCTGSAAACPSNGRIAEGGACNTSLGQCSRDVCCPGETLNPGTGECSIGASNIVFVTSVDVDGTIPGVAAADALCNQMANSSNLAGTYHAWLSAGTAVPAPIAARTRVSSGPYVLVNGVMFSSGLTELIRGGVPDAALNRTEWNEVRDVPVWTGTRPAGTFDTNDCAVWNSAAAATLGDVGRSGAATAAWTQNTTRSCASDAALYCFQDDCPNLPNVDFMTDRNNCGACGNVCPVACINGTCAARAFVTSVGTAGSFNGLTGADAFCNERAARGMRTGTYRAFLSQGATAAATRVLDTSYYRFDNQRVARSRSQLISTARAPLDQPLNISETGTEIAAAVWTGTIANGMPAVELDCTAWSTLEGTATVGDSTATGTTWIAEGTQSCRTTASLYCFQVAP